jgi:CheY-like chemotaxis protein
MPSLPPLLLVDDDSDDLFILRRLLGKAGIENKAVAFEDSKAAVAHLVAEIANADKLYLPCVVFTDLHMPRVNGFELTRWIRTQPMLADTVVVMISSSEDPRDRLKAMEVGVRHFLLKYPPASVLQGIVREAKCGAR